MYVNRETGSSPEHNRLRQWQPSVRPGQGGGLATAARPTTSKGWRPDSKHGQRRPAAGVTAPDQQRPVRPRRKRPRRDTLTRFDDS